MLDNPMTLLVAILAAATLTIAAAIALAGCAYRFEEWRMEVDRDRTLSKVFMKETRADTDQLRGDVNQIERRFSPTLTKDGQPKRTEGNQ